MKKIALILSVICLVLILPGCVQINKTGQYSDFARWESDSADEQEIDVNEETIRIYGVYPEKVSTEGKEMIRIYGAGFEQGAKIFLNNPQISLAATYINPGTLEAWLPPYHEGLFILGVINPDGSFGRWPRLFVYEKREEEESE